MPRIIAATRYLILFPIVGLALAAAAIFVFGGIFLLLELAKVTGEALEAVMHLEAPHPADPTRPHTGEFLRSGS